MSESAFSMYIKEKSKKNKKSKKLSLTNGKTEDKNEKLSKHFEDHNEIKQISNKTERIPKEAQVGNETTLSPKKSTPKKVKQKKLLLRKENSVTSVDSFVSKPKKLKLDHKPDITNNGSLKVEQFKKLTDVVNSASSTAEKASKILSWLLYPMQTGVFFDAHWESQPVHIIKNQEDYFTSLLTSKDIDVMLREHPLHFDRNVDVVEYINGVRKTMNPQGRATPSIVWDAYSQGCSVRILNPQTYNNTIHFMLATLQEYFGTMVGANIYLTPAGSQGFAPHYDDIEAFIVQLEGKKHWKLYKPLNDADNLARFSSKDFSRDQLGGLVFDAVLNAGDVLYFPRGMVHEAKTLPGYHSLHMTISSYQRTSYADLMENLLPAALQTATNSDIEFRKGLPLNYLKHLGTTSSANVTPERMEIMKTVQRLFFKVAQSLDVDSAADVLGRKFMYDALPPVLEHAEQSCSSNLDGDRLEDGKVVNSVELTLDTNIRLMRYYSCRFVKNNDEGVLYFSTQNARVYHGEEEQFIPTELEFGVVIEILQLHYPDFVPVSLFPVEDKEKLLGFIMQLWDYGIITTKKPAA